MDGIMRTSTKRQKMLESYKQKSCGNSGSGQFGGGYREALKVHECGSEPSQGYTSGWSVRNLLLSSSLAPVQRSAVSLCHRVTQRLEILALPLTKPGTLGN